MSSVNLSEPWHGTLSGYTNHKCRCEACTLVQQEYRRDYHQRNKESVNKYNREYRIKNIERLKVVQKAYDADPVRKAKKRARKFGISTEELSSLLEVSICSICNVTEPGGNGGWHIDHNHECCPGTNGSCGKCIRGILCHKCNVGLGHFNDNPILLRLAAEYLE